MMRRRYSHSRTLHKASLFSLAMAAFVAIAVMIAIYQTPPLVLGTEMNANGSLEYMCLGRGCESLPGFYWID